MSPLLSKISHDKGSAPRCLSKMLAWPQMSRFVLWAFCPFRSPAFAQFQFVGAAPPRRLCVV